MKVVDGAGEAPRAVAKQRGPFCCLLVQNLLASARKKSCMIIAYIAASREGDSGIRYAEPTPTEIGGFGYLT